MRNLLTPSLLNSNDIMIYNVLTPSLLKQFYIGFVHTVHAPTRPLLRVGGTTSTTPDQVLRF